MRVCCCSSQVYFILFLLHLLTDLLVSISILDRCWIIDASKNFTQIWVLIWNKSGCFKATLKFNTQLLRWVMGHHLQLKTQLYNYNGTLNHLPYFNASTLRFKVLYGIMGVGGWIGRRLLCHLIAQLFSCCWAGFIKVGQLRTRVAKYKHSYNLLRL